MQQDKKFKISVDDAKIRDLRSTANELARDMIMSARQYSTSSKQVIQDIEEQIRLIEKRNKLDQEIERAKIESQFVSGDISKKQRKEQLGQVDVSGRTDELQVKLLREVIDTIKSTAREEIRADRANVERQIQQSKTVDVLSPKGDAERILAETIQRGELGETGRSEAEERRDFTAFSGGKGKADRALAAVAGAQNEYSVLAAGIGATLGVGAGIAANRLIQSTNRFQQSAAMLGRHTGMGVAGGTSQVLGMGGEDAFLTPSQVGERFTNYRTAGGGREFSSNQMRRAFIAERQLGVGVEDISGMAGATRYGRQDPTLIMAQLESHLRRTSQDISVLPELMKHYTSTANNILQVSTHGNVGAASAGLISLAEMTGATGMELGQWTRGVQGLGQTQNPMVRSMLMRAFRDKNPNASLFEIQAMMENPMAHLGEIGDVFSMIQGQMGGDMARQAIYSMFGGQVTRSAILGAEKEGGLDFSKLTSDSATTSGAAIMGELDAAKFVPTIEKSSARVERVVEVTGDKLLTALDKFIDRLFSFFGKGAPWSDEERAMLKEGYSKKYGDDPGKVLMEDQLSTLKQISDKTQTREEFRLDVKTAVSEGVIEAAERNKVRNISELF